MRIIGKSDKLNNVRYDVRGPVLDEANRIKASGFDVLHLNIGNPAAFGFRVDTPLVEKMAELLDSSEAYSDSKGILSAREAVCTYCAGKGITGLTPDDVYLGNGVSELILMAMQGLLNPGDEVLIPSPDYPLWTAAVTISGGKPVHYICDEASDWYPDTADIERKITPNTKAIVIINPNNPTGAVYSADLLMQIVDIARRHELIVFSDEIYDRLLMDGVEHTSIASLDHDMLTVTFSGLSKSEWATGFRIGWMCLSGDKSSAAGYIEALNLLSSMRLCSNVPAQQIVPYALADLHIKPEFLPGGRIYEQRELIVNALNSIPGISTVKPKATFYIFPKIDAARFGIVDDERFALDFLKSKHVLIVHGSGFNWHSPDHFRIVYLPEVKTLETALNSLESFLQTYRQS